MSFVDIGEGAFWCSGWPSSASWGWMCLICSSSLEEVRMGEREGSKWGESADKIRELMGARLWILIYNDFSSNSTII